MTGPSFSDVRDTDVEQAEAHLPPSTRLAHGPTAPFALHRHTVERGPLHLERTRSTDGIRIEVVGASSYAVGLAVRGLVHAEHRGEELDLDPGPGAGSRGAVFDPRTEAAVATGDRFDAVLVRIRSVALEDTLEALLGRSVRRPLRLRTTITLGTAAERAFTSAIRCVADAVPGAASPLSDPIRAEPLQDRLLVALLRATDHPDRDALEARVPSWGPRPVRRCVELVEEHPQRPLTPATLAAAAGVSVRALEGCWVRHRDHPPGHDVARVRLDRAHRDLADHRPGETTVAAVAASWGFRPGPFVAAYAARFGRDPGLTLRGPAFA